MVMKYGVGQPVRRFEDLRLLTGRGRYQDDLTLPRQAYAIFVRSPHAHARIRSVNTEAALAAPGVVGSLHRRGLRGRRARHAKGDDAAQEGATDPRCSLRNGPRWLATEHVTLAIQSPW